ncbi:MAG: hypothetical protein F9K31_06560 [Dokdonella sp.]|nr:MAG: hypothetical protein F9K31_06560 [Dokdonella sp.]
MRDRLWFNMCERSSFKVAAFVIVMVQAFLLGWQATYAARVRDDSLRAQQLRIEATGLLESARDANDQANALLVQIEARARRLRAKETSDAAQVSCL